MHAALLFLIPLWHVTSLGHARIVVDGSAATVELRVQAAASLEALDLDLDRDQRLSAAEVAAGRDEIERYVLARFRLSTGAGSGAADDATRWAPLAGRLESLRPVAGLLLEAGGEPEPLLELRLRYEAPHELACLTVESDLFREADPGHRDHVEVVWAGRPAQARVLSWEAPRGIFDAAEEAGAAGVIAGYTRLGFDHILGGWDHVAFLVALVAASRRWPSLLGVVTAFTLAHSLSLALAASGVVALPAALVEPAIALSIAWVATRNVIARGPRRLWPEAFGFGLVHGLGFAGFVGDLLAEEDQKLAALFGFNAGVEIGQAAIVLALFLFLRGLAPRDAASAGGLAGERGGPEGRGELRGLRLAASGAVALLGIYWSVSRVWGG